MSDVKLKPDKKLRDALFTPEAMSHPAKAHLGMMWEIIERYTEPGQWILDPMAGIGSTLFAALLGRNVVCVEMEQHFLEPMLASWAKMQQHGPMLGHTMGEALILRGDARCLPLGSVDVITTSPPYEGVVSGGGKGIDWTKSVRDGDTSHHPSKQPGGTGSGELSYTRPDTIITSPPYEGSIQGEPGIDWTKVDGGQRDRTKEPGIESVKRGLSGYTRPDAIITSPPYEGTRSDGGGEVASNGDGGFHSYTREPAVYWHTQRDQQNIGNLKNKDYWAAMRQTYSECHRVLKPGGTMVLIVKGFTRDGQYIDLPQQTAGLVETLGFKQFDRWERELWKLSFWRILQQRRDPQAFDDRLKYESVIAFVKGDAEDNADLANRR